MQAVLFDLFETLITESGTRPPGVSSLAGQFGCERSAFRALWKPLRRRVHLGQLSFSDALGEIARELGQTAGVANLRRASEDRARSKAVPFERIDDEVLATVRHLRERGVRLAVISNCCAEDVLAWSGCALAPHVDAPVFSYAVGAAKPDPEIYRIALRRLGVEARAACFIGDGQNGELEGAEAEGLRAYRASWFLKRWPHFREEPDARRDLASPSEVFTLI